MKFYDAFAGIGGFHLGITQAHPDWECIGACEIDKYARKVYQHHFPKVNIDEDIKLLDRLPEGTELFCGGFPCQSFSIAGKREGFNDTRGTLFFEIARLCEISRPKMLFLENVQGLLNHDGGQTFSTIIRTLTELGYCIEWQVLNSKYFIPQNRERVFIIGHLGGEPARKVFPLRQDDGLLTEALQESEGCFSALKATDYKGVSKERNNCVAIVPSIISHSPRCGDPKKGGTGTLTSSEKCFSLDTKPHYVTVQPILTPDRLEKRQNGRRIKEDGEPSFSLTAQDRHGVCLGTPSILNLVEYKRSYANASKNNSRKILFLLQKEIGTSEIHQWRIDELASFWENEILQSGMYEKILSGEMEERSIETGGKLQGKAIGYWKHLHKMWEERKDGYTPQRQKQIEQLIGQFGGYLSLVSHQGTSEEDILRIMRKTAERILALQSSLYQNETWKTEPTREPQMEFRIRRLLPLEAERLQGFPDDWTAIEGNSDSQRYKQLGNAVTVNVIKEIAGNL